MNKITPNSNVQLYIIYAANNIILSGLSDITVEIKDISNNVILEPTTLVEEGSTGKYSYDWNIGDVPQETSLIVMYKQGSTILYVDDFFVDVEGDNVGRAF